jgi:hypothetical protein
MTANLKIEPRPYRAPASALAQTGLRDMLAVVRCAEILTEGAREATREWARLAEQCRQIDLQSLAALALCRSQADLVAAQAGMVSGRLDLIGRGSGRLAEIVNAAAGGAVRALSVDAG